MKEKDQTIDKQLTEIYENIKSTPSYSAKINEFLRKNNVHSTHKRIIKKKFPRRRIIARVPFEIMQADLFEYPMYKYQNRHYVYALVLIDCFSRKLWVVPMKHKTDNVTAQAFESIFSKLDNVPVHIVTDGGKGKIIIYIYIFEGLFRILQYQSPKCIHQLRYQSLQNTHKDQMESCIC